MRIVFKRTEDIYPLVSVTFNIYFISVNPGGYHQAIYFLGNFLFVFGFYLHFI